MADEPAKTTAEDTEKPVTPPADTTVKPAADSSAAAPLDGDTGDAPQISGAGIDPPMPAMFGSAGPHRPRRLTTLAVIAVLALTIGTAGGYALGATLKQKSDKTTTTASSTTTTAGSAPAATQPAQTGAAADTTHFASSYSTPFDLKKHVLTALGLPASRQGVNIHSDNNDRGDGRYFTDKFNDEMGRWKISSLDPAKDATEIGLFAIGQEWLHSDQPADDRDSNLPINTAAQKATYIASLKTRTADCAKDKTKGFVMQNGTLNVCYSVARGKYQGAKDGVLELDGYGSIDGQPMILTGFVDISSVDSNEASDTVTALTKTTFKIVD